MTDNELKFKIIKKRFIEAGKQTGIEEQECLNAVEELMKEEKFIFTMMLCMDEWAGVISARIDEEDDFEKACKAASYYLSNDSEEIPEIIRSLQDIEDGEIFLDDAVPNILVWEKLESSFTVAGFLDAIGL